MGAASIFALKIFYFSTETKTTVIIGCGINHEVLSQKVMKGRI
jgi:hypothetical protein